MALKKSIKRIIFLSGVKKFERIPRHVFRRVEKDKRLSAKSKGDGFKSGLFD